MSNSGVFDVNDIRYLMDYQQWPTPGELQLIQTQVYTADVATIDFTSIQENIYDVHFLTLNDFQTASDNKQIFQIQLYESGVLETASVYQAAFQRARFSGNSFTEYKTTGLDHLYINQNNGNATNEKACGYVYFYNLGDNTKYSFTTSHTIVTQNDGVQNMAFGSQILPQASVVDGIRLYPSAGNYSSFKASLYGIRFV